ncbi:localization factor PodJL [Methylobacterium sp. 174MFSha1.1]|uniref:SEL1-like repeat protein n=1 Tax=Methylobacterium sp. 174MFSha1.1 TaxID=1502749 RepID=UPI0008EC2D24|nr:SEL1-like repeat protein [Methylobacterium sp. 174MFSha1.1]SFU32693.1 localization factor PodJL [Methylobacterium sp. 174MFSha1.1]
MRRTAPTLDAFDPELRDAAREAARRAGLSVDEWLAEAISEGSARAGVRQQSRRVAGSRRTRHDAFQAQGFPEVEAEGRRADRSWPHDAPRAQRPRHGRVAETVTVPAIADALPAASDAQLVEAVAAIGRRLDAIDRRISENREAVDEAVIKAVQDRKAAQAGEARSADDTSAPRDAATRPAGRRARPAPNSLAAAVAEIRQRQQQLDDGAPGDDQEILVDGLRRDLARVMETTEAAADKLSPAIAGLQAETSRLRDSIGTLATSGDLVTLEQAVRTLADEVQRARDPADLVAVAGPIDLMRVQVGRLADDVAANVHARVAQDVERLARQMDGTLGTDRTGLADRDAAAKLFAELEEIRSRLAVLAEPARVQNLARSVDELTETVTRLGNGMLDSPALMNELRPLLEEIREGVRAPGADAPALAQGIADLDRKLDDLRAERREQPNASGDILGRIDALSAKVDQVASVNTVGDVMGRLEQIGEALRQPALPSSDLASIHGMLRSLADKLDRVGQGAGGETLDGLERQVLALASRIDTRGSDPALAGLERTMGDLLAQVALLRDEAPIQAAAERAARSVADSIGAERKGAAEAEGLGGLQAMLADMRAQQAASDKRLQATMEGVHSALEQLVSRLTHLDGERRGEAVPAAVAAPARHARNLRDTLRETTTPAPEPRPARRPEAPKSGLTGAGPANLGPANLGSTSPADEMIEPGAVRPRQPHGAETGPAPELPAGDIKASFIAAARRAAQAAAAEAAGTGPALPVPERSVEARGSLVERLRAAIERRRRPLLLGIAAIVLALGTLQALHGAGPRTDAPTISSHEATPADPTTTQATGAPALPKGTPPVAAPAATAEAKGADTRAVEARPAPARPDAVKPDAVPQKGAETVAPEAAKPSLAARPTTPRVTDMASLNNELAALPAGASSLRQAALDGDGAAIYELASRAVDGRGLPRDTALAAKLFDRLAGAGYAPAQYRLGSQYEKGLGLVRDQEKARLWYGRAAMQGHVRAMHNLAVMMAESGAAGGKPDYASAATWFRKAAEYGVRDSQYNLAVLQARGLGVAQDLTQAYGWFAAAAAQGDDDAGRKRDEVAGKLAPKDLAAARSAAEAWKARVPDPAVNDPPAARVETAATPGAMSLIGAPPPLSVGKGMGTGTGKV